MNKAILVLVLIVIFVIVALVLLIPGGDKNSTPSVPEATLDCSSIFGYSEFSVNIGGGIIMSVEGTTTRNGETTCHINFDSPEMVRCESLDIYIGLKTKAVECVTGIESELCTGTCGVYESVAQKWVDIGPDEVKEEFEPGVEG